MTVPHDCTEIRKKSGASGEETNEEQEFVAIFFTVIEILFHFLIIIV